MASDIDESLVDSLKIEASHNVNRLKSYRQEANNNKIFEYEREKGLGDFLEDQERWDLVREHGLRMYRKQKKIGSPVEGSPDHKEYLKEKRLTNGKYEQSLKVHVNTRDKVRRQQTRDLSRLETEELQLNITRPRYEPTRRYKNKWVGISSRPGGGISSSGSNFQNNFPQVDNYVEPSPGFTTAPAPYEGFDEVPPPPIYDGSSGIPYDPAFGDNISIPPPPPPPDYDF
ncbi:MAG: hypothetical protein AABY53_07455 [Bdellovibrionota bacterium]